MARRVIIRSRQLGTDVAKLEEMIKADWKELWKHHQEELESICDEVLLESQELLLLCTIHRFRCNATMLNTRLCFS